MTLWRPVGEDPGSWLATLPSNRVPRHSGEFIMTLQASTLVPKGVQY